MNNSEEKDWKECNETLAGMSREMPFTVPENYFDSNKSVILTQILLSSQVGNDSGFCVPENFFEKEKERITKKVQKLRNPDDAEGFKVPEQYFATLSSRIQSRVEVTPTKKILKIWTSDLMKYAAAACFILMTATALYFNTDEQKFIAAPGKEYFSEEVLYDIDVETILEHVDYSPESEASATLTVAETENYILDNYSSSELLSEY